MKQRTIAVLLVLALGVVIALGTYGPAVVLAADPIFSDDFESGDFSAWTSSSTDSGDLSVTEAAAMEGAYGMQAVVDDSNSIYVTKDWRPSSDGHYRARFYFDINSISSPSGATMELFVGWNVNLARAVIIQMRTMSGEYQLQAYVRNDSNQAIATSWYAIGDSAHAVEIDFRVSAEPGADNGSLDLWIDGEYQSGIQGIDNDTKAVSFVRLGVMFPDAAASGTMYFDDFVSDWSDYIGLNPGISLPTHTPTASSTYTPSSTYAQTASQTASQTSSQTPSHTPTQTASQTPTATPTNTATITPTRTDLPFGFIEFSREFTAADTVAISVQLGVVLILGILILVIAIRRK